MTRLGFVTIGQSPRQDIIDSMLPDIGPDDLIEHGALDSLDRASISQLQPGPGETPLVTRLATSEEVTVSKSGLMPYLQSALDAVEGRGAETVVILCTGAFPELRSTAVTILPDAILRANVDALLPRGCLGVVMPNDGQLEMMQEKWERQDRKILAATASPYSSNASFSTIGESLSRSGAKLIVLDCMGYTQEMKRAVSKTATVPVILANRLVGRVIEELISR